MNMPMKPSQAPDDPTMPGMMDDTGMGDQSGTYTFDVGGDQLIIQGTGAVLDAWDSIKEAIMRVLPTAKLVEGDNQAGQQNMGEPQQAEMQPQMPKGIKAQAMMGGGQ